MRIQHALLSLIFWLIFPALAFGQLSISKLISDGMVLQRNAEIEVRGWADEGEVVEVNFRDSSYKTTANNDGQWNVSIPGMEAGGPYSMVITASDTATTIDDIMIGEVWVSSGQSNMELSMKRVRPLYKKEIDESENSDIRYFDVPQDYNFQHPKEKLDVGEWRKANPRDVLDFSAVAYFFAKDLHEKYGVPIGIIDASVGGSPVESWISETKLKEKFPDHFEEARRFRDSTLVDSIQRADQRRIADWYSRINEKDRGYQEKSSWYDCDFSADEWPEMNMPGYWEKTELGDINGVVWFRKGFELPEELAGKSAKLLLGRIVDSDSVFVNGKFVGSTGYQYPPRRYEIPRNLLKEGRNFITIRVINEGGKGGFIPDKPYKLLLGDTEIDLTGTWQYRLGAEMDPLEPQTFIRWKPLGLYNAMIAPIQNYRIKGVIWYQGESNTDQPVEYQDLFSALIDDWRDGWNQGEFPFLYVQLANYMEVKEQPSQSNWAMLREAQRQTLSVSNTGMAVAIDIGEWNDIHPLNKKDVGKRLALSAQKVAYGDDIVDSGPVYKSMEISDRKMILTFDNVGRGLVTKDSPKPSGFAIAGPDCKFVWAEAEIKKDRVIVWSDSVVNPKVVRYAWADNPERANLYNEEGLPASPFSTGGLKECRSN